MSGHFCKKCGEAKCDCYADSSGFGCLGCSYCQRESEHEKKQIGWYEEEQLDSVWEVIGEEQTHLAEIGMEDYSNSLLEIDKEE